MEYGQYNARPMGQQEQPNYGQPNYGQPNYGQQPAYDQGNYQPQPPMDQQQPVMMGGGGMMDREDSLQGSYSGPAPKGGIRPRVDPEASGEVDPEKYPQPKESTHKIRGRTDVLELLCGGAVDPELLTAKTFYFFFYSAFGSLFPLMAVYFKQMGMNPGQCGMLIGSRPFVEFLSAPFWGSIADRTQKGKILLLASLTCWIVFTVPLGFIQPPATSCILRHNHTEYVLRTPGAEDEARYLHKRSVDEVAAEDDEDEVEVVMEARGPPEGRGGEPAMLMLPPFDAQTARENEAKEEMPSISSPVAPGGSHSYLHPALTSGSLHPASITKENVVHHSSLAPSHHNDQAHSTVGFGNEEEGVTSTPLGVHPPLVAAHLDGGEMVEVSKHPKVTPDKNQQNEISSESLTQGKLIGISPSALTSDPTGAEKDGIVRGWSTSSGPAAPTPEGSSEEYTSSSVRVKRSMKGRGLPGQSPIPVAYASNYDPGIHSDWLSPIFSPIVYRAADIQKAFFLLLLLVIIGEFFSAPAVPLADAAVLSLLGEAEADRYGHQRMFGSLGWGLAMFFVGIALDHATSFPEHPCGGPGEKERNYTICFATFSVLMGCALMTATQLNFKYDAYPPPPIATDPQPPPQEEEVQSAFLAERGDEGVGLQMHMGPLPPNLQGNKQQQPAAETSKGLPFIGKTKMFAQVAGMGAAREVPEWVTVLKQFGNVKCASFLFVSWFMGFGIGLIFTFLFWHLQDYGGSPTLFGVASVINHISEIFAYFFSFRLITQIGHVKVLCLGLVGNVLRFLYISWLKNPWWVLPFEFMQGITHAAVWAACCSYLAHNTPHHLRGSAQGVLQGIHHGLGRGCGALIGGVFVYYFGTAATFRGYGFCCLLVLAAFIFINFYRKETGFVSELPPTEDPRQVAEETSHLAPHGVPSNPIPRALSSTRLHEMAGGGPGGSAGTDAGGYGATYSTSGGGNLDVPGGGGGGSNPFRTDGYSYSTGSNTGVTDNSIPKSNEEFIKKNFQAYNEAIVSNDAVYSKPTSESPQRFQQQPVDASSASRGSYKW
ncbi:major facilitator superfamily domain-containing protein 6 isoform X2 [Ischnura elegans]|uniref:major facilitator superfamily domain-containing protein 6 isoform X2 n=1 Tax=Ischnura elegans TaxID=197161 RepID=UPI001ED8B7F0|nr:major facilitator superfamily domain-containing protein 6 isoform X2 [Ischnura elegans]